MCDVVPTDFVNRPRSVALQCLPLLIRFRPNRRTHYSRYSRFFSLLMVSLRSSPRLYPSCTSASKSSKTRGSRIMGFCGAIRFFEIPSNARNIFEPHIHYMPCAQCIYRQTCKNVAVFRIGTAHTRRDQVSTTFQISLQVICRLWNSAIWFFFCPPASCYNRALCLETSALGNRFRRPGRKSNYFNVYVNARGYPSEFSLELHEKTIRPNSRLITHSPVGSISISRNHIYVCACTRTKRIP